MKKNRYFLLLGGLLLSAGMTLWTSCTDDWNEHYNQEASDLSAYPTLLARLKDNNDPDVRKGRFVQFVRVLEATGFNQRLANPALFTVFAPMDMTAKEADEWIDRFNQEKSIKQETYNTALTQFVQNHISLYGHNFVKHATSETTDTVSMLNGKFMRVHNDAGSNDWIVGPTKDAQSVITEKLLCNNGYLYKIAGGPLPCYLNVKEATDTISGISKYMAYKGRYDEYTLDESKSVPGDVVDGNVEYIDSVLNYENKELDAQYGAFFHREDSLYLFLVPTDKLWDKLYRDYSKYFNYEPYGEGEEAKEEVEALKNTWTSRAIMYGRVFNLNSANNLHRIDSLCATNYSKYQTRPYYPDNRIDYRTYVFRNPNEGNGILKGLKHYNCSNGSIYVDDRDEDYLVKDRFYKTWFTSTPYSTRNVGIAPRKYMMSNGKPTDGGERFKSETKAMKSSVPWIVCRKKKCGKKGDESVKGEGFKKNKIYNVRVNKNTGDSIVYYLDTIGTKNYRVGESLYRDVREIGSTEKIYYIDDEDNKSKEKEKDTHVYYDFPLGDNIMSKVFYNAYVVTVPSDAIGASTRAQGLAFRVIENYDEDEIGENAKYVPYNENASKSFYPEYDAKVEGTSEDYFETIYVGDGDESATLKCKLAKDGFVMTDSLEKREDETPEGKVPYFVTDTKLTRTYLYFFPYENGNEEYGKAGDDFYVRSSILSNKVYVPKTQDVDVIQVMRARSTNYATAHRENAPTKWVLRVYNALTDCSNNFVDMAAYDSDGGGIKLIKDDLFNHLYGSMRIARIIVKPFKTQTEAKKYTIADLMEEYHLETIFQRTEE